MKHLHTKLAAYLTTGALLSNSVAAFAGDKNFSDVADKIVDSSSKLPNLISTVAYVGGMGLGMAGVFKLKQHVDNPGNAPMKDGLIRLGAGGALLAFPTVTESMMGTIGADGQAVSPDKLQFDAVKFN